MQTTVTPIGLQHLLTTFIQLKMPTLVTGRPGIGKSDIITKSAKDAGYKLILRHAVTDTPMDYKGLGMAVSDTKADFIPFGDLDELINATEPTFCFFDDLGQASTSVQAAIMQPVLARTINGHKISDHVVFGAATNRISDKSGVNKMLNALLGRFNILHLEVSVDEWVSWALKTTMPIELINACRFRPQWLTEWKPSNDIDNTPTPRNIEEVGKMMQVGFPKSLELPAYASRMGIAAATELIAFLNIYRSLPTIDQIVLNPMTATIPSEPSAAYVIASAMVKRITSQSFNSIIQYMERLPKEYTIMMIKDIAEKRQDIVHTREYIEWVSNNQMLL